MTPAEFLNANAAAIKLNQKYLAALAALSYDFANLEPIAGLTFLQRSVQTSGYDAAAYFHKASGVLLFVNRGTEGAKSFVDWIEGASAAILRRFNGQLKQSVLFVLDTVKKLGRANGLAAVKLRDVSEIICAGHSLGGALAESQVALCQALAAKAGEPLTLQVSGVGFASAGFAGAIHAYADSEQVVVEDDMHWLMNHYIRGTDPILLQPGHGLLGEAYTLAGIYVASPVHARNGRGFEQGLNPPLTTNHDARYYFDHFELKEVSRHLFKKANGSFLLCEGISPSRMHYGTTRPESVIVGVPYP